MRSPTSSRWLAGLLLALLVAGGCQAEPAPEPFGDFTVGVFGGIGGRSDVLYVHTDGDALLVSYRPASGRLAPEKMSRLRMLLESGQFRRDVAAAAEPNQDRPDCSDLQTVEVTMGSLSISVTDACGDGPRPELPAFGEIVQLVQPELRGDFDQPVASPDPRLVPIRLERLRSSGSDPYLVSVDAAGRADVAAAGASSEHGLTRSQRDTLRLLIAGLIKEPVRPCTMPERYRLTVSEPALSGPDCGFWGRRLDFYALTRLLEEALGL